jgi:hypothetical protein
MGLYVRGENNRRREERKGKEGVEGGEEEEWESEVKAEPSPRGEENNRF